MSVTLSPSDVMRTKPPMQRETMTGPEVMAALSRGRRSKFNVNLEKDGVAKRTYKEVLYASEAEAKYAAVLDLRQRVGELAAWWRQINFPLIVNGKKVCDFVLDFKVLYAADKSTEIIEIKGAITPAYRIKVALFRALNPDVRLIVIPAKDVR